MSEWFREAFSAHYLSLYAHRDVKEARHTVDLILKTVSPAEGSRVLDIPCGAGRHARHFAGQGMVTIGVDLSWDLIKSARAEGDGNPLYIHGDMRHIPACDGCFHIVANLFSSFGYFKSEEENLDVLREFARVCRKGGHVVIDFFNEPHIRHTLVPFTERKTDDGWLVREYRRITTTPARVEKTVVITSADGEERKLCESVRLYTSEELAVLMKQVGLDVVWTFGDYRGGELSAMSRRAVLIGRKP